MSAGRASIDYEGESRGTHNWGEEAPLAAANGGAVYGEPTGWVWPARRWGRGVRRRQAADRQSGGTSRGATRGLQDALGGREEIVGETGGREVAGREGDRCY